MFLTVHATAGVIVGQQTGNLYLAFLAGVISHIVLDIIPHGDQDLVKSNEKFKPEEIKKLRNITLLDVFTMTILLSAIYLTGLINSSQVWPVLLAVTGAILPDFLSGIYALTNWRWLRWQFQFQYKLHYLLGGFTINLRQGLIVQTIFLAILIMILKS